MAVLGWSIPQLRAMPSLQADGERQTERNVRLLYYCSNPTIGPLFSQPDTDNNISSKHGVLIIIVARIEKGIPPYLRPLS